MGQSALTLAAGVGVLSHGSSVSSRLAFELSVPGDGEFSFMEVFARYRCNVWTMYFEGYGRPFRSVGNSNVADGAEDLKAAALVVSKETGQESFHLYDEWSGTLRAGVFAMAETEMQFGTSVPTGTFLDMAAHLPMVDPTRLPVPVLIARGEYDGIASEDDLLAFFQKLPVADREFVVLPGASDTVTMAINRRQFWHVLHCYLDMPLRLNKIKE